MIKSAEPAPAPIRRYLECLERELKKRPGATPEEGLADAWEFLRDKWSAVQGLPEERAYAELVASYGLPAEVADGYAEQGAVEDTQWAPGWRVCCTSCGRSAPAASLGMIRLGARSSHKYTLGACRQCGGLRWARVIQDLEQANLTPRILAGENPHTLRRRMHRPWTVFLSIFGLAGAMVAGALIGGLALAGQLW